MNSVSKRRQSLDFYIIALAVLGLAAFVILRMMYRPFSFPSESMIPTLMKGDYFLAKMSETVATKVGGLVLVETSGSMRVYRVVGLAGDRIEVRGGVPIINNRAADQKDPVSFRLSTDNERVSAVKYVEKLPGEVGSHSVLNIGDGTLDDFAAVIVPPNSVFLLGDNRDNSADSRLSPDMGGIGMVPISKIRGKPWLIVWSADSSRVGTRLSD